MYVSQKTQQQIRIYRTKKGWSRVWVKVSVEVRNIDFLLSVTVSELGTSGIEFRRVISRPSNLCHCS